MTDPNSVGTVLMTAFQVGGWPLLAIIIATIVPLLTYRYQLPKPVSKTDGHVSLHDRLSIIDKRLIELERKVGNMEVTNAECVQVALAIKGRVEDIWEIDRKG